MDDTENPNDRNSFNVNNGTKNEDITVDFKSFCEYIYGKSKL